MKKLLLGVIAMGMMLLGGVGIASALDSTLVWTNTAVTFGIQVEKAPSVGGTYVVINQTAVNAITYIDSTPIAGDTACYRIAYFNTSGVGPYAGPVCKTFPSIPTQMPAIFGVN